MVSYRWHVLWNMQGIDPCIRAEVWLFLLGLYVVTVIHIMLNSSSCIKKLLCSYEYLPFYILIQSAVMNWIVLEVNENRKRVGKGMLVSWAFLFLCHFSFWKSQISLETYDSRSKNRNRGQIGNKTMLLQYMCGRISCCVYNEFYVPSCSSLHIVQQTRVPVSSTMCI